MTTYFELDETNSELTEQEIAEIEEAEKKDPAPDEDSTAYTYEELASMLAKKRESERTQVVSVRLSRDTINKAKKLGKGYTAIMSRIITYAMDNPDLIKRCM